MTGTGQQHSPGGEHDLYIHLGSRALPRGISDAEAVVLIVPRGTGAALMSIYVHVLWFPSRTAAEHLDRADFRALVVTGVLNGAKLRHVTRTFRSAAGIAALAKLLNSFPAAPKATQSCPASNTFQITFVPRTTGQPEVTVATEGCYQAAVMSRGVPQPALEDQGNAIAAAAARMLGVNAT